MGNEVVSARVGSSTVFVEAVEVRLRESRESGSRYGTEKTSRDPRDAYAQLKELLRDVADDMGTQFASPKPHWPDTIRVEFGMSFAAEANVWVFKATGEMTCTVSMTWEKVTDQRTVA